MDLPSRIAAMWKIRGSAYQPRTRHLSESNRPLYTNRLFLEKSPYLLQHAHNPVDWYPWGNEAFEDARRLDRPVLLSVGYSTCHWCHVMEEESFEDEEIAGYINDTYIAVKVDREERPDVDAVYMSAVQAISGRGGWPMTVWLTPAREPFYGGTYFPARDGDRGSLVGFFSLLKNARESYDRKREMIDRSAGELSRSIRRMLAPAAGSRLPMDDLFSRAVAASKARFDARHGGIAGVPKFPGSLPIRLLLRHYHDDGDSDCLKMAVLTLERMAAGGMNDQVGGGFHRYSTDEQWLVPHFEKMLYDNALLVPAYIEGWQVTRNSGFVQVARATLDYVAREMTAATGGFYSAGDADSLTPAGCREEGYFFTWTRQELDAALGPHDATIAAHAYGVTDGGNWEGRSVLHLGKNLDGLAVDLGLPAAEVTVALDRLKRRLYEKRRQRPAPLRDDKILVAWNGLMISAFVRSGFAMDDAVSIDRASKAADFILEAMVDHGRLKRSYREGGAGGSGFLDDYAFFTAALLDLFNATAAPVWLAHAMALDQVLVDHFEDRQNGGFFMTANDHETLIAREKPSFDGAVPSGNAVALMNLVRLYELTLDAAYYRRAEKGFTAFSGLMEASPLAFGEMLRALANFLHPAPQVIAVSPAGVHEPSIEACLRGTFLPGSQVMMVSQAQADRLAAEVPGFHGKVAVDGKTTVYVCRHGTCGLPVSDAEMLMRQLRAPGKTERIGPGHHQRH